MKNSVKGEITTCISVDLIPALVERRLRVKERVNESRLSLISSALLRLKLE